MECKWNQSITYMQNGKMKVRSYSRFDSQQDKREVRAAYLEQAKFCIEAYFDIIANGTLNEAADKINQAAFCVQQAKKTNW